MYALSIYVALFMCDTNTEIILYVSAINCYKSFWRSIPLNYSHHVFNVLFLDVRLFQNINTRRHASAVTPTNDELVGQQWLLWRVVSKDSWILRFFLKLRDVCNFST